MVTKIRKQLLVGFAFIIGYLSFSVSLVSCEDFFEQESEHVIYYDNEHLNNAVDTIYSLTGILSKLEALGDRTILLGELRGDLVSLTDEADANLREIASFNISDDNIYNSPKDYYAVINNCNYYIAHADTALKNNRNEYIFMREYTVIKAIRAWTYLQLVINYGRVPFVTDPILSEEDAEKKYSMYELQDICSYFINDLKPLTTLYGHDIPLIGKVQSVDSRYFYYPLWVILGDLYLWAGGSESNYREAALCYYNYINERNGNNSSYPTGVARTYWPLNTSSYNRPRDEWSSSFSGGNEGNYTANSELITVIAGDSLPSEPNYSQLRLLFNSREENDYKATIVPSTGLKEISEAQYNCLVSSNGSTVSYAPHGLTNNLSGDLRLSQVWDNLENVTVTYSNGTSERIDNYQSIYKWNSSSRNVPILRRQMVYLRMAEALNMAGYPRMAFMILSNGLNNTVINEEVRPYYNTVADSLYFNQFDFPASSDRYVIYDVEQLIGTSTKKGNTLGIHSRGSGWTPLNEYYRLPNDTIEPDAAKRAQLIKEQQEVVDDMLNDEGALELAFEGTRFYDLMRFALRRDDPGAYMKRFITARNGYFNSSSMSAIGNIIADPRNWYLRWHNGAVGY